MSLECLCTWHACLALDLAQVDEVKVILKELEKEGMVEGEAAAVVWLWNQRQQQLKQLREWRVYLTDLQLADEDTSEGLKVGSRVFAGKEAEMVFGVRIEFRAFRCGACYSRMWQVVVTSQ